MTDAADDDHVPGSARLTRFRLPRYALDRLGGLCSSRATAKSWTRWFPKLRLSSTTTTDGAELHDVAAAAVCLRITEPHATTIDHATAS